MIRRIKTRLKKFFEEKPLTDKEKHFIIHISKNNEMFLSVELATSEDKTWSDLIEENKSFFDYVRRTKR